MLLCDVTFRDIVAWSLPWQTSRIPILRAHYLFIWSIFIQSCHKSLFSDLWVAFPSNIIWPIKVIKKFLMVFCEIWLFQTLLPDKLTYTFSRVFFSPKLMFPCFHQPYFLSIILIFIWNSCYISELTKLNYLVNKQTPDKNPSIILLITFVFFM